MKYHAGVGVGWGQWTSDKWRNKGWPLGEENRKLKPRRQQSFQVI